jgi:hypothetical protein
MNISITFDDEQTDALNGMVADYNTASGESLTAEQYLTRIAVGAVDNVVESNYQATVRQIGDAAKTMSYADRQALIASIQEQIA